MEAAIASTGVQDSREAGHKLAAQIRGKLAKEPDAIVLFAAPTYDHLSLLQSLRKAFASTILVGASSAGEFTSDRMGEGLVSVLALQGEDISFGLAVGRGMKQDAAAAARQIAAQFKDAPDTSYPYRAALIMTDALAGHAESFVDELTLATGGQYAFFGGGAGDNAQFEKTVVFHGEEVLTDAAVALEILSQKPLGIGATHGWEPASEPLRVTEADGMSIVSLNGFPAVEAFHAYAERTGQQLDRQTPIPFFLHNILGIDTGSGHRLRVPLAVGEDGSVSCASEIPVGSIVQIMRSSNNSAIEAARRAADSALVGLQENRPKAAIFFDCVATRLRLGEQFASEVDAIKDKLGSVELAGCNTHGQIVRAEGQFQGFHNCTAVLCVFPE